MNCRSARKRILEADLAELDAESNTELGWHFRACAECRASAGRVLKGMVVLDNELATARRKTVDVALADLRRNHARRQHRVLPWAAAAAILAALVLTRAWDDPPPLMKPATGFATEDSQPIVENAAGADMAIFATRDPYITVIWIFEEENR
jgi:hypothetical protein